MEDGVLAGYRLVVAEVMDRGLKTLEFGEPWFGWPKAGNDDSLGAILTYLDEEEWYNVCRRPEKSSCAIIPMRFELLVQVSSPDLRVLVEGTSPK